MNDGDAHRYVVQRWNGSQFNLDEDYLADESVVQLALNGSVVATVLATNADLEALAIGHFACEHGCAEALHDAPVHHSTLQGVHIVEVTVEKTFIIAERQGLVTTSCGACTADDRSELIQLNGRVDEPLNSIDLAQLLDALPLLNQNQPLFAKTGGVHAAGLLYSLEPGDLLVREDIGRHNAVDKVVGAHLMSGLAQRPMALTLSGRCGWDIVAKAARMNIPVIASIGAASSLAAETARACGITLVTFGREGKGTVIGAVQGRFQGKD